MKGTDRDRFLPASLSLPSFLSPLPSFLSPPVPPPTLPPMTGLQAHRPSGCWAGIGRGRTALQGYVNGLQRGM